MDPGFEARLARRREQVRRQRARRNRMLLAAVAAAGAVLVAFLLIGGDPGEPEGQTAASADKQEVSTGDKPADPQRGGVSPDPSWKPNEGPVPILMYHVIGPPAGDETYPGLFLDTVDFRAQVNWLAENGYTAVTLVQVQNAWYDGGTLPPKPIVLSFDDGYLGQYLDAMPILSRQGWAGLLNLKAEGSDLSSKQVGKMIQAGWEIASHTITHPDLTTLDSTSLETELVDSKRRLEKDLGIRIVNFCYPAGKYDDRVAEAVEAAGYRGATTVDPGLGRSNMPFELQRVRIDRGDGADALAVKLANLDV